MYIENCQRVWNEGEKIYMLRNNDIEICNKWHQKKHISKNQFAAIFFFRQGH